MLKTRLYQSFIASAIIGILMAIFIYQQMVVPVTGELIELENEMDEDGENEAKSLQYLAFSHTLPIVPEFQISLQEYPEFQNSVLSGFGAELINPPDVG